MEKYIDLLRFIIKNFDIKKNNEFDNMIKYIINKIFDKYYHNRNKSVYCIDNLIRKYSMKYYCIQKTYRTVENTEMIFRF